MGGEGWVQGVRCWGASSVVGQCFRDGDFRIKGHFRV